MPQILRTLCALFALLCLASAAQVSAAPAPPLTQVVPVALRAEETVWIPAEEAYPNRLPEGVIFRGDDPLFRAGDSGVRPLHCGCGRREQCTEICLCPWDTDGAITTVREEK